MLNHDRDAIQIGQRLRLYLKQEGLTHKQLLKKLGSDGPSQPQVSKWCNAHAIVPAHVLAKIARIVGQPIESFFPEDLHSGLSVEEKIVAASKAGETSELLRKVADELDGVPVSKRRRK
jgi:transcriptional regulator with XRE-family HTH domain